MCYPKIFILCKTIPFTAHSCTSHQVCMHTSIRMYLAHMQLHVVYIANGLITEHERVNVHQVVACRTCKAVELLRQSLKHFWSSTYLLGAGTPVLTLAVHLEGCWSSVLVTCCSCARPMTSVSQHVRQQASRTRHGNTVWIFMEGVAGPLSLRHFFWNKQHFFDPPLFYSGCIKWLTRREGEGWPWAGWSTEWYVLLSY